MRFSFDLAGEHASWLYLPVPYHNQLSETDADHWNPNNTCMATALTMMLDYKGLESDVNVIVALLAEIDPLEGGYDPSCRENPVCASAGAVAKVAEKYCASVTAGDDWSREDVITEFRPDVVSVERLYSHYRHPQTAVIMGHARGIIYLCAANQNLPLNSYASTRIKKSVNR